MGDDGEKMCELFFLDSIYNKTSVNWITGEETEESLLAEVIDKVNYEKPTNIVQNIDSWGGSAPVGFGIYNFLKGHSAKVKTRILNNCASIATVMSFAGSEIEMPRNGIMVIHQAQNSAQGTAKDLRDAADVTDVYTNNVLDVYVQNNRKGKKRDELYNLIKDGDYWMTGTQAMEMGFVDSVYNDESITITNSIEIAKKIYNKIPEHIQKLANEEVKPKKNKKEKLLNKIKKLFNMEVVNIMNDFKSSLPNNGIIKVENGKEINISNLLEQPLTNVLNAINESIKNEIQSATNTATNTIKEQTEAIENKYKEVIDSLKTSVEELKVSLDKSNKSIENLTADIERATGRPTPAAGKEGEEPTGQSSKPKTFAGRTTPVSVSG